MEMFKLLPIGFTTFLGAKRVAKQVSKQFKASIEIYDVEMKLQSVDPNVARLFLVFMKVQDAWREIFKEIFRHFSLSLNAQRQ